MAPPKKDPTCPTCNNNGFVIVSGPLRVFCLCAAADSAWLNFLAGGAKGDFEFPFAPSAGNANDAVIRRHRSLDD